MKIPIFGGAYEDASPNVCLEESINLYPEVVESAGGKVVGAMRGTPGLQLFTDIPTGPIRGLWMGENRLFVAAGSQVYELTPGTDTGGTYLGAIDFSANTPVQFFVNGNQLMVISNNHVYVSNGGLLTEPTFTAATYDDLVIDAADDTIVSSASFPFGQTDKGLTLNITSGAPWNTGPLTILSIDADGNAKLSGSAGTVGSTGGTATETPGAVRARTAAVLDGYAIVAPAPHGSPGDADYSSGRCFYISAPNDFTSWDAIDVASKDGYPDNILALLSDHQQLYVFGDLESMEVWQDTGNPDFPFGRNMSAFVHHGLAAQYSLVRLGMNGIACLAWSAGRGSVQALYAQGSSPQRVSTAAIETIWRSYPTVTDCEAYSYHEDGHEFWVLNFPTGDATWVYDLTASQQLGKPMWHRRGWWDGTTLHRQRARCHTFGYVAGATGNQWANQPVHFVGDWEQGYVYAQGLYYTDDNGADVMRRRTFGHMSNEELRTFWSKLQLDCEVGYKAITASLEVSRDHGHTFSSARDRTANTIGDYAQRLIWWRLGAARDLVFRLTITGKARVILIDGYAEAQAGGS